MSKFNKQLKDKIGSKAGQGLVAAKQIKKPDTVNREGAPAHSLNLWLRLLAILNTSKTENQFYRTENQLMKELKDIITILGKENPYQVAQCIVYSRCVGEGMRSVNHLASVYLAPFLSGQDWAKRFYSTWNKKAQSGGTIFRPDDMSEIMACYKFLNPNKSLPNSMKKGFASAIEGMDLYAFGKYTKQIRDVANMVHPIGNLTPIIGVTDGKRENKAHVLNLIMNGINIPAHTWENAQSSAGEIVAKAQREGKIDNIQAVELLQEAKAENWNQLLSEGKLGILALLRNLRNILLTNPTKDIMSMVVNLLTDPKRILQGKIMPYQFDLAYEVIKNEFNSATSRVVLEMLQIAYQIALPNLEEMLQGNNLVIFDQSGSMWMQNGRLQLSNRTRYNSLAGDKAIQIAKTLAKATNADVIRFGQNAEFIGYDPSNLNLLSVDDWKKNLGGTNLEAAWRLAAASGRKYERVFILSDYECNRGNTYAGYQAYVNTCGNPYVYQVDLAAYGTTQQVGPKVRYYYGFGYSMFDDITKSEFNASYHLDKVRAIKI